MINRRHALLLGGAALITRDAVAQSKYPERPIRLVVPIAPGGLAEERHFSRAERLASAR